MRVPQPGRIHGAGEPHNGVHSALWAQCGLILLLAVAPRNNGGRRKFGEAVVTGRHIACEQLLAV